MRRNRSDGVAEAELGAIQRRCRAAAADLIGAGANEIALAPNTSFGVNLAASLLLAGKPGAIVVSRGEFPANVLPFLALESRGFRVRFVECDERGLPDEEGLMTALTEPDVVALALSTVQFATGYLADATRLGSACRERGALYFLDAIQGLGACPFDVRATGADIVASGGQKWLCAPWGSGFVWVRPDVQARFDPPMVSWLATADGADFGDMLHYRMEWRDNARKFELATLGIQDYLGLARSIEVLLEVGVDTIHTHLMALHGRVIDWLDSRPGARLVTPRDPSRRGGILTFELGDATAAAAALRAEGVVFSVREGAIRLAPHFYNTLDEMDEIVRILEGVPG